MRFALILLFLATCVAANKSVQPTPSNLDLPDTAKTEPFVGHVIFDMEVNEESVLLTQKALLTLAQNGAKAILLEINSPGGQVEPGFQLAKTIENLNIPVVCVVDGEADSMAFYILQSCSVRLMTERSILMTHAPRIRLSEDAPEKIKLSADAMIRAMTLAHMNHLAHRMRITPAELLAHIEKSDWWMGAEEAMFIGAVDGVVPSVAELLPH